MRTKGFILGFGVAIAGRALIPQLLRFKFVRDVSRLNAGDYSSLLAAYGDDFVLHFNEGDHRPGSQAHRTLDTPVPKPS
jgi:hypothetical protein